MKISKEVIQQRLDEYEGGCESIGTIFLLKYFDDDTEIWWVGDDVTGVACIGDYYFDVETMYQFMKYKYPKKLMFEYYDYALDLHMKNKTPINIANYKKLRPIQ